MSRNSLAVCILLCVSGCGGSESPFDYVKVTGKVTFEDGSLIPASSIKLGFTAVDRGSDASTRPRPANAVVNVADGTFECVTSYKYCDGLVPGKHRVGIVATDDQGQRLASIAEEYALSGTSPLIIDTEQLPLEIKVPKAK